MVKRKELADEMREPLADYPEGFQFNLSDFALFLSVMKHKEAYESTISIILDEPDVKMKEVKVEEILPGAIGYTCFKVR